MIEVLELPVLYFRVLALGASAQGLKNFALCLHGFNAHSGIQPVGIVSATLASPSATLISPAP